MEKPWVWAGVRELARDERLWRELDAGFEVGIAEQLLFLEPFPALTFGSASVESTALKPHPSGSPEQEETQVRGNQGKKEREIRRELEKQGPQF